ncbi:MAG: alpha/beta fold hydrolase [Bacteroidales bacterium]|nr:alpha/beta fold hydrolase [Bacteroidales bacterium]
MKHLTIALALLASSLSASAEVLKTKLVDDGGSGLFKAIAVKDAELPDFVIYHPKDMTYAHARCGAMPILIWANGACLDSSIDYERMLTEIASRGYVVLAIGEMQDSRDSRKQTHTQSSEVKRGLDWIFSQARTRGSDYFDNVDTLRVAAAGHSCGGAQVLANAADPRLSTCLIMNAGMGDIEMAGASRASLPLLHTPTLYVTGGESDVAFQNARKDYERISHVPVAWANHPASGHGGTYGERFGGDYARIMTDWLDWQLKKQVDRAETFLGGEAKGYSGWSISAKNFIDFKNVRPLWIMNGDRQIFGELFRPSSPDKSSRQPVAIIAHGFNGTHHFGRAYFDVMGRLGYQCYVFDFPCGSVNSRSDNNTLNMSILDEQSDLRAIVNYFRAQPDVDPDRIVLIGESQGGLVSALTAAQMPDAVSRLVLVFPALCIPDNWRARYPRLSDIPEVTTLWNVKMGRRFFEEIHDMKPFDIIAKFKKPVLIVQGDKDNIVHLDDSRRAQRLYKDARLHIIPGAGHGFKPSEFQQETSQLELFLK